MIFLILERIDFQAFLFVLYLLYACFCFSDDEVTIHVHKKHKKSQLLSSDEDGSQRNNSPSRPPGTPKTTTVEQSLQHSEKGSSRGTPIRKIPSISSEGSQSKVSLQKKTSISTEGGYQASIEDEQSVSNINEQETVLAGQGSRPLIAIPVCSLDLHVQPETSLVICFCYFCNRWLWNNHLLNFSEDSLL